MISDIIVKEIIIGTFSEKDMTTRAYCFLGLFEVILMLVLKVLQGIGQLDEVLPWYKFWTCSLLDKNPGGINVNMGAHCPC